jgi:hypothetical protein
MGWVHATANRMNDLQDENLNAWRVRPPPHVLKTICAWAIANELVASVHGVGSRFSGITNGGRAMGEDDDLDLIVTIEPRKMLPDLEIEAWRATLSILTAFRVDLRLVGSGRTNERGYLIFQRE